MFVMVDVEADGPCPGLYSMIELGAVIVEDGLARTFHGRLRPVSENWVHEALAVSGATREATLGYDDPGEAMQRFAAWFKANVDGQPMFVSDNNGFDWQFVNWYFWRFVGANPFGHSSVNLGSLYKGLQRDMRSTFKHLRRTRHTHHSVDDAKGNAEALIAMQRMGLKIGL